MDVVHIREPDLDARALVALVADAVALARGTKTRIVVNDRLDVALAAGAAGVHLKTQSAPPAAVRAIVPAGFLVGRSVRSAEEAVAVAGASDYVIAGTVWPTESKSQGHEYLGPVGLARIARAVTVPTIAIGGVTLERMAEVREAGAAGAAAIGLFMGPATEDARCRAQPLRERVEMLRQAFDRGRSAS